MVAMPPGIVVRLDAPGRDVVDLIGVIFEPYLNRPRWYIIRRQTGIERHRHVIEVRRAEA